MSIGLSLVDSNEVCKTQLFSQSGRHRSPWAPGPPIFSTSGLQNSDQILWLQRPVSPKGEAKRRSWCAVHALRAD